MQWEGRPQASQIPALPHCEWVKCLCRSHIACHVLHFGASINLGCEWNKTARSWRTPPFCQYSMVMYGPGVCESDLQPCASRPGPEDLTSDPDLLAWIPSSLGC